MGGSRVNKDWGRDRRLQPFLLNDKTISYQGFMLRDGCSFLPSALFFITGNPGVKVISESISWYVDLIDLFPFYKWDCFAFPICPLCHVKCLKWDLKIKWAQIELCYNQANSRISPLMLAGFVEQMTQTRSEFGLTCGQTKIAANFWSFPSSLFTLNL